MGGASINTSNNSSFGSISNYNSAGKYEFNRVASINGDDVTLEFALLNSYDVNGAVQMVTVPEYSGTVSTTGTVQTRSWNGTRGGVTVYYRYGDGQPPYSWQWRWLSKRGSFRQ